jgi:hypothetical protein
MIAPQPEGGPLAAGGFALLLSVCFVALGLYLVGRSHSSPPGGSVSELELPVPLPRFVDQSTPGLPPGWRQNGTGAYRMDGLRIAPWAGLTLNLPAPTPAQVGELLLLVEVEFAAVGNPAKCCEAVRLGGLRTLPEAAELVDRWYPLPEWWLERLAPSPVKP